MPNRSAGSTVLVVALLAGLLGTGCAPASTDGDTITYWASNQAKSAEQDQKVLAPELAKFTRQTGIKVKVEVIPWGDLLNRILGATTSGHGPDVVNLGNTWAASLQATGAFVRFDDATMRQIGGTGRFLPTSMSSTGAPGQVPASVPLYGLSYGLFYNRKLFQQAGIRNPPSTRAEFVQAAKKLTDPAKQQWGLTVPGASYTENAHFAFIGAKQQGASLFDATGQASYTSPQAVEAVRQYVDLMATDGIVSPDDAEVGTTSEAASAFSSGRAAMMLAQNNTASTLEANGMTDDEWGVAPMPLPDPLPAGGERVNSHVAGINIAVPQDSPRRDSALTFVKFMTSKEEQQRLNRTLGSLPVVVDAYDDPAFSSPKSAVFRDVLTHTAAALPMIPNESQFETTVGAAMRELFARAATGHPVTAGDVRDALTEAQQKTRGAG